MSGSSVGIRWLTLAGATLVLLACGKSAHSDEATSAGGADSAGERPGVPDDCRAPPNVAIGSLEDVGSLAAALEHAPGSASSPLPFDSVTESPRDARSCKDGSGGLWLVSQQSVARYDEHLTLVAEFLSGESQPRLLACDETGILLADYGPSAPYLVRVRRYEANGLDFELELDSSASPAYLRQTPFGPGLFFYGPTLTLDDVTYTRPDDRPNGLAFYAFEARDGEPRLSWLESAELDADAGSFAYSARVDEFVVERLGPDGEVVASNELPGIQLGQWQSRVLPDGRAIVLLEGSLSLELDELPQRLDTPRHYLIAFGADASVEWAHALGGPGQELVNALSVAEDGSIWVGGVFEEWLETAGHVAYGHLGTYTNQQPVDWFHRFVAKFEPDGSLTALGALGPTDLAAFELVALDGDSALVRGTQPQFGAAKEAPQFARTGELPRSFVAIVDAEALPPQPLPKLPEETLPELGSNGAPGSVVEVFTGGDGRAYVAMQDFDTWTFVDALSGEVSPVLAPPGVGLNATFAVNGDDVFFIDPSAPADSQLVHYRRAGERFEELGPIPLDGASGGCGRIVSFDEWLFVACLSGSHVLRRAGASYAPTGQVLRSGFAFDFDGETLAIGFPGDFDLRSGGGGVYLYTLVDSDFGAPVRLNASDSLPFEEGRCAGDFCEPPPPGKGFGWSVQLSNGRLLVRNNLNEHYGYEQSSTGWVESWKQTFPGPARYDGQRLLVSSNDPRGRTLLSGALRIFEHRAGTFVETRRIVPAQRWPSSFGPFIPSGDGRTLVAAPNYGKPIGSSLVPGGKVFALELGDCAP